MATLTVWEFPTADGADRAEQTLLALQKQQLIKVHDAAIVSWQEGKKKPRTRQLSGSAAGAGAAGGAFWGLLFGLIFFVPFFGMAIGAATGALAGSMADFGIDDSFIKAVREKVTPGTSALFVMTSDAVMDRVHETFADQQMELIQTNLSIEDEAKLREMISAE
jgi:uncharacterized membrane protein